MNESVASLKLQGAVLSADGGATCSSCGEAFETPLLAMVFSEAEVQEYYACPNCLSKVASIIEKPVEPEEVGEVEEPEFDVSGEAESFDAVADAVEVDDEVVGDVEAGEAAVEEESVAADVAIEGDVEGPTGCTHYLGYLKKRGNTPIPEDCLTCSKMIDCMY